MCPRQRLMRDRLMPRRHRARFPIPQRLPLQLIPKRRDLAVADHDADTLQAVTTVYGLTDGRVRLTEIPEGFLAKIGVAQSFVKSRAQMTHSSGSTAPPSQ